MTTLAETLGIYRSMISEDAPVVPTIGAKTNATLGSAAYNDVEQIADDPSGKTAKAQQDLAAAKENVPVLPSDRTPQQQAQLDKAKSEVEGLPLDHVLGETRRSAIFQALVNEGAMPPLDYQAHVMASLYGWLKRHMPEARRMIWLFSGQAPELANKTYRQILLPRIVKWDFPHHFSMEYMNMIEDLLKTLAQQKP